MRKQLAVTTDADGGLHVRDKNGNSAETVGRYRDHKQLLRSRLGYEVTNADFLNLLLDVYDLHLAREGRHDVLRSVEAEMPVAADGGEPK